MMLVKNYKIFSIIQKILLWTWIFVSLFFLVILLYQKNKPDWNIVFIVNVSHSMNVKVADWNLSRLDLWKKVIESIVKKDNNQHQIGVIIFSKQASYYVAPTFDTGTLLNFTKALQTNILPWGWSNLDAAIDIFHSTSMSNNLAVVISDWDDIDINSWFNFGDNVIGIGVGDSEKWKVLYPDRTTMIDKEWKIIYSTVDKSFIKKTSKKAFFVGKLEDIEDVDLWNMNIIDNDIVFKLCILISLLIVLGLKL